MIMTPSTLQFALVGIALSGWVIFGVAILTRPRNRSGAEKTRDRNSHFAILVQGIGFALAWGWRRAPGVNVLPSGAWQDVLQLIVAAFLAWGSVAFAIAAVRTLGRQWSLTARVLSEHRLITTGPYAVVRHPIYTAMFGLMLATGIAMTTWPSLMAATGAYLLGTLWRVHLEERLLRETFGAEHAEYVARVPALIPGWR